MSASAADFSYFAELYARARPTYPPELFAWLAEQTPNRQTAWDCATGNGQAAHGLTPYFDHIVATDGSEEQIAHAVPHPKIEYRAARAEASGLEEASVDLVTVAAAAHWFDPAPFHAELRRVVRPGGVAAVWTYHVAHLDSIVEPVISRFCFDYVRPYFAAGAELVDDKYRDVHLPGTALQAPEFRMTVEWDRDRILAFLRSWSGTQEYLRRHGEDPTGFIRDELDRACAAVPGPVSLSWPLYLKASRL